MSNKIINQSNITRLKYKINYKIKYILLLLIMSMVALIIEYGIKPMYYAKKQPLYNQMVQAAEKMQNISQAIYARKIELGIEIPPEDIHQTGLIGQEWSYMTTTLGSLESKRTSTNPDFAALMVRELANAGITSGDTVAVNMSGSFPALNLATIVALDTIGARGMIIASIGASTYGANDEDFNYIDMEQYLYSKGLIRNHAVAYSVGGDNDIGAELDENILASVLARLSKYELEFINIRDFDANLKKRIEYYNGEIKDWSLDLRAESLDNRGIKAFVNIGGNLMSTGKNEVIEDNASILLKGSSIKGGLVGHYLSEGMPVFCLLNIKSIAAHYGLPVDPIILPEIGTSPIYFLNDNHIFDYLIISLFVAFIVIMGLRKKY